jgi:hypothetical protein
MRCDRILITNSRADLEQLVDTKSDTQESKRDEDEAQKGHGSNCYCNSYYFYYNTKLA